MRLQNALNKRTLLSTKKQENGEMLKFLKMTKFFLQRK